MTGIRLLLATSLTHSLTHLFICSIHPPIFPSTHHLFTCKAIDRSTFPYIYLSIHPSDHQSIHPTVYLSIHPSIRSSIHLFIHPFIHTSIHPYIDVSIHPYIHSCIHPYIKSPINPRHTSGQGRIQKFRKGVAGSQILERGGGRNSTFQCCFQSFSYKSLTNIPPKGKATARPAPPLNPRRVSHPLY